MRELDCIPSPTESKRSGFRIIRQPYRITMASWKFTVLQKRNLTRIISAMQREIISIERGKPIEQLKLFMTNESTIELTIPFNGLVKTPIITHPLRSHSSNSEIWMLRSACRMWKDLKNNPNRHDHRVDFIMLVPIFLSSAGYPAFISLTVILIWLVATYSTSHFRCQFYITWINTIYDDMIISPVFTFPTTCAIIELKLVYKLPNPSFLNIGFVLKGWHIQRRKALLLSRHLRCQDHQEEAT